MLLDLCRNSDTSLQKWDACVITIFSLAIYGNFCYIALMLTHEEIDKAIHYYRALLTKLEAAINTGPEGSLYYRTYPSGLVEPYISVNVGKKRIQKHLNAKDVKQIEQLKKRTFASKMLPKVRKALKELEKAKGFTEINLFQEALLLGPQFAECADHFLGTTEGRIPNPAFDCLIERQNPIPFGPGAIDTEFGKFRSKSEAFDRRIMHKIGARVKYEPALPIGGRIFYVDFAVDLYWKSQIGVVEHHGLLDDPKYRNYKMDDLNYMIRNGYYPGQNLLILSDSPETGYDEKQTENLLRAFCLP